MCHIHRIWYSCSHGDSVLHSKCRTTRIKLTRMKSNNLPYEEGYDWKPVYTQQDTPFYQVAACKSHATLEINLQTKCGPCRFSAVKRKWDREVAKTRAGGVMMGVRGGALNELLEGLRLEKEKEEWECRKMYPPEGRKGPRMKARLKIREIKGPSPLRNEIQPHEIDDVNEVGWNELINDFDKPEAEGEVDGGTFMDFFEDRYGWMGPLVEVSDMDGNISTIQISDTDTKEDSSKDIGYSSAEPEEEPSKEPEIFWDCETAPIPTFADDPERSCDEHEKTGDEFFIRNELGGICTFAEMNDRISEILALGGTPRWDRRSDGGCRERALRLHTSLRSV